MTGATCCCIIQPWKSCWCCCCSHWSVMWLIAADKEEKDQCNKMHAIIKEHGLDGEFRWLVAQKDPVRNGELYRYIAGMHAPDTVDC